MGRVWIAGTADGRVQVLFGRAAVKERRRVGREIDGTIARAIRGELQEGELGALERLALLADSVARGKAS